MGLVIVVIPTVTTVMWGMVVQSRPVKLMEEMVGTTTLTRPSGRPCGNDGNGLVLVVATEEMVV